MAIRNEQIFAAIKALHDDNREEHAALNSGITECKKDISTLKEFKEATAPRLNGMSRDMKAVQITEARWYGARNILITIAIAAACGVGGWLLRYLGG